ncbi:MAG: S1 family peptidase [Oscillospiraceae bacterium]|nr:S1 family peptidase [Oscillospiraceae bacterium]
MVALVTNLGMSTHATDEEEVASRALFNNPGTLNAATPGEADLETVSRAIAEIELLRASFLDEEGNAAYPDWYGGVYINQDFRAVVMVTYLNRSILSYIMEVTGNTDVLLREVRHSHAEILRTLDVLSDNVALFGDYLSTISLDDFENRIYIGIRVDNQHSMRSSNMMESIEENMVRQFESATSGLFRQLGIDPAMIAYEFVAELPIQETPDEIGAQDECLDALSIQPTTITVRPGQLVRAGTAGPNGSLAYRAIRNGEVGYTASGHVFTFAGQWAYVPGVNGRFNRLGQVRYSTNPYANQTGTLEADVAFIHVAHIVEGYHMNRTNEIAHTTGRRHNTVAITPTAGLPIAFSGHSSGYRTGQITRSSVHIVGTLRPNGRLNLRNQFAMSMTGIQGDSGGIVHAISSANEPAGVVVGSGWELLGQGNTGSVFSVASSSVRIAQRNIHPH